MLNLNSIKNGNIRGKKISHMENFYNTGVVFARKIHHTVVGNIYNAVEFASLQNLFVTCNENRSSALKLNLQLTILQLISIFTSIL